MHDFIYWAGVAALVWFGLGLVTYILSYVVALVTGAYKDNEWLLGLVICIGGGPFIAFMALRWFLEDLGERARQRNYERERNR